jgi:Zn-finger nucleic acid-binding protein
MAVENVPGALVDVCSDCGGVWVDWLDGEVASVARRAARRAHGHSRAPGALQGACPGCGQELYADRYEPEGPEVFRCGGCAGTFVPRASLGPLGRARSAGPANGTPALTRALDALREWLLG